MNKHERGLLKPRSGDGVYQEGLHPAATDLAETVAHHWAVRWELRGRDPYTVEVLPHPAVQLVVEDGRCRVHGVLRGRFSHTLTDNGDIFGTTFRPAGFRVLLGRPVAELTDRVVDGSTVFGDAASELTKEADLAERIRIAGDFVRDRLPDKLPRQQATVNELVAQIEQDRTILRVEDVAGRHGTGPRNLQKLFRDYVGVTPKWVIRRYRLHEAAQRLDEPDADLAGLAAELGYADQAHFARDFKAATGRAPRKY